MMQLGKGGKEAELVDPLDDGFWKGIVDCREAEAREIHFCYPGLGQ